MQTLEKPKNPNYCATVVRIGDTFTLKGCDNVVGASIHGFQVILGKDTPKLGIFFPAETQLSDAYCMENNLYRHADKNREPDQKGYIEDNRRVRAVKFRGHTSNGFYMPLESLEWTQMNLLYLQEGDTFDTINDWEICRKYVVPHKEGRPQTKADRGFVRADSRYMPEHIDTENFFKNADKIDPQAEVIVTQKLHGTSVRIGHTMVNRKPGIVERIAEFLGAKIAKTEYVKLYGSKKVIKDANNPNQNHYYDSDIWTLVGKRLDEVLPKNYIVYGEIVGWTPEGKEVQRNYTYGIPKGEAELYVYRIAIVNEDGLTTDLNWNQVKEFCVNHGIKHVPELMRTNMSILTANDFKVVKEFLDVRFEDGVKNVELDCKWRLTDVPVSLGDNKELVDEGICVREDGLQPKILKAKSPKFFEHETAILDAGEEDIESEQTNVA